MTNRTTTARTTTDTTTDVDIDIAGPASLGDPTAVHLSIEIDAPASRTFQVFTQRFDDVKPREHNLLAVEIAETVLEPWVGGRVYDRAVDGTICQWARVLAVEPPRRIVLAWDISPAWQLVIDQAQASEVEITFVALADDRTRVELVHRHLDRHGDGWQGLGGALSSADGWPLYLERLTLAVGQPTDG